MSEHIFPLKCHIHMNHFSMPFRGRGILASYNLIQSSIYSCDKHLRGVWGVPLVVLVVITHPVIPMLPCRVTLYWQAGRGEVTLGRQINWRKRVFLALTSTLWAKLVRINIKHNQCLSRSFSLLAARQSGVPSTYRIRCSSTQLSHLGGWWVSDTDVMCSVLVKAEDS